MQSYKSFNKYKDTVLRPQRSCSSLGTDGNDATNNLAPCLSTFRSHDALVQTGVVGAGPLDQQGGDFVLNGDRDSTCLLDCSSVVSELQVVLVSTREADVKSDVVALIDGHLLHGVGGAGGGLHDVLPVGLHHHQVAARLGGSSYVFQQASEHSSIIGTGLQYGQ